MARQPAVSELTPSSLGVYLWRYHGHRLVEAGMNRTPATVFFFDGFIHIMYIYTNKNIWCDGVYMVKN